jgi:hypothetical protein
MAQFVTIQNNWDSAKFHCPACGAEVFTGDGEATDKPCEHVLFSWIDAVGDFYNAAEALKELLEDEDSWSYPSDEEFLSRCPDTAVLFALEHSGMACGPVSLTAIHAIEFPVTNL